MSSEVDVLAYRRPFVFYAAVMILGAVGLILALAFARNDAVREIAGALVAGAVISGVVVGFEDRRESLRWKAEQELEARRASADDLRETEAAKLAWRRDVDLRTFVVARSNLAVSRATTRRAIAEAVRLAEVNERDEPRPEMNPAAASRITEFIENRQELLALGQMSASSTVANSIDQWGQASNFDDTFRMHRPSAGSARIHWLVESLEPIKDWLAGEEREWETTCKSLDAHEREMYGS